MCGIIGIVMKEDGPIGRMVFDALERLEYRGYDSVGLAVINGKGIDIAKDKGAIGVVGEQYAFKEKWGKTAIGHSRWATHGAPSQINAHPHISQDGDVVVIHNGIIENFIELRQELINQGYSFVSQTDTEVIPHFISNQLKHGKSMLEAIKVLLSRIRGTYAIVLMSTVEPGKIYALRKDNPLVIGVNSNAMYAASDIPAFLPWTKQAMIIRDGELIILEATNYTILKIDDFSPVQRKPHRITWSATAAQKGGFSHFMLKEIYEQANVLGMQLATQQEEIEQLGPIFLQAKKIVLIAAGTAHYASLTAYYSFPKVGGPLVIPCIAAEWDTVEPWVDSDTILLAVSQSGETLDTIKAVKRGKARGAKLVSVVNVTGSTITTISDYVVYIHAGPEVGVAATKTFTAQSLAVWRIMAAIGKANGMMNAAALDAFDQAMHELPDLVKSLLSRYEAMLKDLAKWFATKESAFYLGRGISNITAKEGALKMKEISYIHAEAYSAGESKHGPIALIQPDYPVVFSIPNDDTREKMMGSVQEMKARGARTIGIIEEGDSEMLSTLDVAIEIPMGYSTYLSTIAYIIPQQVLAYYTSVARGLNPDRPRNLAKSVTVE